MEHKRAEVVASFLGGISIFLAFNPYFVWNSPIAVSGISCVIMCFLSLRHIEVKSQSIAPMVILIVLYVIMGLHSNLSVMGLIAVLMICPMFLASRSFLQSVYNHFTFIYAIAISISLIVFILVAFLNINLPYEQIEPLVEEKKYISYYAYPFLIYVENSGFLNFRFHGLFDEPGVVGTISGAILLTEQFDLKKIKNIPIFISGLLSLSLFFFVVAIVHVIIKSSFRTKILVATLTVISFIVLSQFEVLNELVFERLEFSGGGIAGDNRDHISKVWYNNFSHSSAYWWGLGGGSHAIYNPGGASYKDLIIDYGFVFLVFYIISFIWASFNLIKMRIDILVYIVILLSVLYQRPFLGNISYTFILLAPLYVFPQKTLTRDDSQIVLK